MTKKFLTLLLLLSAPMLAGTSVRPHRMRMAKPDEILRGLVSQRPAADRDSIVSGIIDGEAVARSIVEIIGEELSEPVAVSAEAAELIHAAKGLLGSRYRSGSSGPSAFDCSGFTSYVFAQLGITLRRSSREQHTQGRAVERASDLQPGDLVFFGRGGRKGKTVNHVGIVTDVQPESGTFDFIHSSSSRGVIVNHSTDGYWARRYVSGRRVLNP